MWSKKTVRFLMSGLIISVMLCACEKKKVYDKQTEDTFPEEKLIEKNEINEIEKGIKNKFLLRNLNRTKQVIYE